MKYRVIRKGNRYYPQYKKYGFWLNFANYCDSPVAYGSVEAAVQHCELSAARSVAAGSTKVVWEAEL